MTQSTKALLLRGGDPQAHGTGRLPGLHRPGAERGDDAAGEARRRRPSSPPPGRLAALGVVGDRAPAALVPELPGQEAHRFAAGRNPPAARSAPSRRGRARPRNGRPGTCAARRRARSCRARRGTRPSELEREPVRLDLAAPSPVAEADERPVAHRLVKRAEGGQRRQDGDRAAGRARGPHLSRRAWPRRRGPPRRRAARPRRRSSAPAPRRGRGEARAGSSPRGGCGSRAVPRLRAARR